RKGTLWEGPFRSVLVENSREALALVGAYIDLNAVRAGIVEDAKDYRFCGYGEAVGRGKLAEYALLVRLAGMGFGAELLGRGVDRADSQARLEAAGRLYRLLMFEEATDGSASEKGRVLGREAFWKVDAVGGGLSRGQLLRCRIRYMTEGAVIGSRAFVEDWFAGVRETFGRRQTGARSLRGGNFAGLCSLRDLRDLRDPITQRCESKVRVRA
ncbi:MAG: hypothetical protein JJT96_14145, partial [Opitutales bacterium]|nr:hypothetical protein [Opitutales bacterium]